MHKKTPISPSLWWLTVILFSSLALKLALWYAVDAHRPDAFLRPDSSSYLDSAAALLQLGRFAVSPSTPDEPMLFRTPGYPAFVALIGLATDRIMPSHVSLVQIGLSLLILVLVYWLGRTVWQPFVGMLAAALVALDLSTFAYTFFVLSETLFSLMLLTLSALIVAQLAKESSVANKADVISQQRHRRGWGWFSSGLLLAGATFVRPISYYLPVPIALLLMGIGWYRGRPRKELANCVLLLLLPSLLLVGGWQWRNWQLTGINEFSTVTATNLLLYRGAGIVALRDGIRFEDAQEALRQAVATKPTYSEQVAYMKREGMALLRRYPLLMLRTQLEGAARMLIGPGDGALRILLSGDTGATSTGWRLLEPEESSTNGQMPTMLVRWGLFVGALGLLFILYAGIAGWLWLTLRDDLRARRLPDARHLVLWLLVLYLVVISAGPEANSRFRIPIMPLLALYSAAGWYSLSRHRTLWLRRNFQEQNKGNYENIDVVNQL